MKDKEKDKTKAEIIKELKELRKHIAKLKTSKTESEKVEEELRKSEKKYHTIFNKIPTPVFIYDKKDQHFIDCNEAAQEIYGYSKDELKSKTPFDLHTPADLERIRKNTDSSKTEPLSTYTYITKYGQNINVDIITDEIEYNGQIAGISIVTDLTERRLAEETLHGRLRQQQQILSIAPQLNESLDVNEVLTRIGNNAREILKAHGCAIYTLGADGKTLKPRVAIEPPYEKEILAVTISVENSFTGQAIKTKKGLIFNDSVTDTTGYQIPGTPVEKNECVIVVPLIVGHTVLGGMCLNRMGNPFSAEDLALAETFAAYATTTLRNAQSYSALQSEIEERKQVEGKLRESRDELDMGIKKRTSELVDINKQKEKEIVERRRAEKELKESLKKLQRIFEGIVHAMALVGEVTDPYTAGHQKRVSNLASAIASEMKLSDEQIEGIRISGLLHDIGKISIPTSILSLPRRLTDIEYSFIKNHSQVGYDILKGIEFPWPVAKIVLQHHERIDGSGYPQGLKGKKILLEAKILSVADVVEAMSSHRPYRPARGIDKALGEILENRGVLYDPQVVDACVKIFAEKNFEFSS